MSWNNVIPAEILLDIIDNMPKQMDLFETTPEFLIDSDYLTSVPVAWKMIDERGKTYGTHSVVDHPSFAALRDVLHNRGFIQKELGWSNGDRVLKQFKLNGELFQEGEQFCCAAALGNQLRVQQRLSNRTKDSDEW